MESPVTVAVGLGRFFTYLGRRHSRLHVTLCVHDTSATARPIHGKRLGLPVRPARLPQRRVLRLSLDPPVVLCELREFVY